MAPRPSSASIGYFPSCVVLTFGSMGMSVCRTEPGNPAGCEPLALAEDAQRQVEGNPPVRLIHDLADPKVAGEAAQDVGVLSRQAVIRDEPVDGVPNRVARVLHQVRPQGAYGVVPGRVAVRLERGGRGQEVVAPRPRRAALDHSKAE